VKIGIIDTGINFSDLRFNTNKVKFITLYRNKDGSFNSDSNNIIDDVGHGTICTQIIGSKLKSTEIYFVKIYGQSLYCNSDLLIEAIKSCIKNRVQLINISLGISGSIINPKLAELCDKAYKKGIIIIASAHNEDEISFPAYYHRVIGVGNIDVEFDDKWVFIENSEIELFANGNYAHLGKQYNGSSFAAPKITANIANYILNKPHENISFNEIKNWLKRESLDYPDKKLLISNQKKKKLNKTEYSFNQISKIEKKLFNIESFNQSIKKIVVVPIDSDYFEIMNQINVNSIKTIKILNNKNSFGKHNVPKIFTDFRKQNHYFEAVAIGKLSIYLSTSRKNIVSKAIHECLKKGKSIFVYDYVTKNRIEYLINKLNSKSELIYSVINTDRLKNLRNLDSLPSNKSPIVLVIGIDKIFTTLLSMRISNILKNQGYSVGNINTLRIANLLGATSIFPLYDNSCELPVNSWKEYVDLLLRGMQYFLNPDIIISNLHCCQNGQTKIDARFFNFIESIKPDGIIVAINDINNIPKIVEISNFIEKFLFGITISFVFKNSKENKIAKILSKYNSGKAILMYNSDNFSDKLTESISNFFS